MKNTKTLSMLASMIAVTAILEGCYASQEAQLAFNPFDLIDKTAPTLAEVTAVPNTNDTTPDYTFSSTEAGTITYGGDCASATASAVIGNNTVTFTTLSVATHSNCTVKVTDSAGNASANLTVASFTVVKAKPFNDTGITLCGDYAYAPGSGTHNNNVVCATAGSTQTVAGTDANGDAVPAGQDAVFGRDSNGATNSSTDGYKGFNFTKLKSDGTALAIQNGTWSDAGSEGAGTKWSCVQDNVTGLIWEIKTNDSGLRDKDWTYSWLNSDNTKNGGSVGTADGGNNCFTTTRCDTEKYVADVNTATLCGASDWRMPSSQEFLSISAKDRTGPAIDTSFFPNTMGNSWSGSPLADTPTTSYTVDFTDGWEYTYSKDQLLFVRLVRVAP